MKNLRTRHLVTTEVLDSTPGFRIAGTAYMNQENGYYEIFLRFLPGVAYYVVKNWDEFPELLIFSGKSKTDQGKLRFFNRIGSGFTRLVKSAQVLELHIPDLKAVYYLHLEPIDIHYMTEFKKVA